MTKLNQKDIDAFTARCDALCKSKLILSDKKISDILKSIAASENFCFFIESCLKDFRYKQELEKATAEGSAKSGKPALNLPGEPEKLIAFTFCLLCELDNKERDFTEFLQQYFGLDELFTDGFANFCNAVIVPFKDAVVNYGNGQEQSLPETLEKAETVQVPQPETVKLSKVLSELLRNISHEPDLSLKERKQYEEVVSAFTRSVKAGDKSLMRALTWALAHMCKNYKFLHAKTKQLLKIFEENKLLD